MNYYKKYLVITHSADSGWDEKRDYSKIGEARKAAREYLADKYYDEAIIVNILYGEKSLNRRTV